MALDYAACGSARVAVRPDIHTSGRFRHAGTAPWTATAVALLTVWSGVAIAAITAQPINPPVRVRQEQFVATSVAHDTRQTIALGMQRGGAVLVIDGKFGAQQARIAVGGSQYHVTPGGTVFVADSRRGLLRYDAGDYTGPTVLVSDTSGFGFLPHPPVHDIGANLLYILTESNGVYVYEAGEPKAPGESEVHHFEPKVFAGSLLATVTADSAGRQSGQDTNVLVAASSEGQLYVLDPTSDAAPRSYATGGAAWFAPTVVGDTAYVIINGAVVSAIDLTGEGDAPSWQYALPARATANMLLAEIGGATYGYVPCDRLLHAFTASDHGATRKWEQDMQRPITYPPVAYDGSRPQVVVATSDIQGIDAETGVSAWTYNTLMQSENAMAETLRETDINRQLTPGERLEIAECFPRIRDPLSGPMVVSGRVIYAPLASRLLHAFTPGLNVARGMSEPATCSDLSTVRSLFWAFEPEETFDTAPAVVGNRAWVGSSKGAMFAGHARQGAAPLPKEDVSTDAIVGVFEASGGDVCVVSSTGGVYRRGTSGWTRTLSLFGEVVTPPVIERNTLVVVREDTTQLQVVDMAIGTLAGSPIEVGARVRSAPSLSHGALAFGDDLGRIHVYQVSNRGAKRVGLAIETGAPVRGGVGSAQDGGGQVCVGNEAGAVYYVDKDGAEVWRQTPFGAPIQRTPAVHGRFVYVPYTTGSVAALNRADGSRKWDFRRPGLAVAALSPIAYGDDLLIVPYTDGLVVALDRATGGQRWAYEVSGRLSADASVSGEEIYLVTDDGDLHTLDPAGAQAW